MPNVWKSQVERDAFVESNCARCFQPDEARKRITGDGPGCPHLARAEQNKLPTPWTRRRNAVMGETYRCAEFAPKAAVNRRGKTDVEIVPMFELPQGEYWLVPVDGWPDFQAEQRKTKEGDHQ